VAAYITCWALCPLPYLAEHHPLGTVISRPLTVVEGGTDMPDEITVATQRGGRSIAVAGPEHSGWEGRAGVEAAQQKLLDKRTRPLGVRTSITLSGSSQDEVRSTELFFAVGELAHVTTAAALATLRTTLHSSELGDVRVVISSDDEDLHAAFAGNAVARLERLLEVLRLTDESDGLRLIPHPSDPMRKYIEIDAPAGDRKAKVTAALNALLAGGLFLVTP
jgi:hypothetical protein